MERKWSQVEYLHETVKNPNIIIKGTRSYYSNAWGSCFEDDVVRYLYGDEHSRKNWQPQWELDKLYIGNYDGGGTALCLAGKGACPPEDIGGYGGYECMKQAFATHPYGREANSYREWLGMGKRKTWDAKAFSIEESNDLLRYVQTLSPIFTKEGGNEDIG